ncbi:hypothetical protein [Pelagibacterium xiamenense]|uniref:hypothetical protein n=1 Tax=Pelagibacterium xiamenense TaxID=2901140 RepID=UPI001E585F6B|nr:hypothetical protein [Pelagibacterium xiamenense]MCD7059434.1 hypothetical protein [Pelagibacterium xiamenense]
MHSRRFGAALAAVVIAVGLSACARPVGDFGRAKPSVLHDEIMPQIGDGLASSRGEPVSDFNLTDEEREMHNRVWRFLVAPHTRDWFYDTAVELQRTRISGATDTRFSADRYYHYLRTTQYVSAAVRYRTVANDITLDIATLPTTFQSICAVIEIDRQRAIAVANVSLAAPGAPAEVAARKWENDQRIAWFTRALEYRYRSYSTALDRLLVETPNPEARTVDALLSQMELFVRRAQAGDFCAVNPGGFVSKDGGIPSRYETMIPEPAIRK